MKKIFVFSSVALALFSTLLSSIYCKNPGVSGKMPPAARTDVVAAAERMDSLLPLLRGKRVALVVNHSSLVGGAHLVDTLHKSGIKIARIFAPEHGFRGAAEAGEHVKDGQDTRTGAPIVSLYGAKRKPGAEDLADVDLLVFDIQDVGVRFYTYISTLYNVMEACAELGKPVLVLDRPNPNGHYVDGPVLDLKYKSFVGIAPIPIVHGCTVGELALMFRGEGWIQQAGRLQLQVLRCENYTHRTPYDLRVKPSPNLPNMRSVLLYPIICLFEGTTVSLGRGTDAPFQMLGHPDFPKTAFSFTPQPNAASTDPPQKGKLCYGIDYQGVSVDQLRQWTQMDLDILLGFYRQFPKDKKFFLDNNFFEKLAGVDALRRQVLEGKTATEIRAGWTEGLEQYKTMRKKYLLYP